MYICLFVLLDPYGCNFVIKIIIIILIIFLGVLGKAIEHIFVSGCTDEEMSIKCPDNHKIAVKRLFYGVKKDRRCGLRGRKYMEDCCIRTHSDCIVMNEREYGKLNSYCSGFPECSYNVTVKSAVDACPDMSHKYTDYMTIIYDCIPGKKATEKSNPGADPVILKRGGPTTCPHSNALIVPKIMGGGGPTPGPPSAPGSATATRILGFK